MTPPDDTIALRSNEARYRALFEGAGDCMILMRDDIFIDCNPAALQMFGCTPGQFIGQPPYRFSPEFQPDGLLSRDKALAKINAAFGGEVQLFEWQHIRHDGSPFDAEVRLAVVTLDGQPCLHATVRDISERKRAEAALLESQQNLLERNRNLRLINDLSSRLHEIHTPEEVGREAMASLRSMSDLSLLALYLLDNRSQVFKLVDSWGFGNEIVTAGQELPFEGSLAGVAVRQKKTLVLNNFSTESRSHLTALMNLLRDRGLKSGVVIPLLYADRSLGVVTVLSESEAGLSVSWLETLETFGKTLSLALANAENTVELAYRADHDSLTQLPNRRLLYRRFDEWINARPAQQDIALMLMDLDRFKEINDTLGHHIGDMLLQQIGPRLQEKLQGRRHEVCRLGGDEFAVLIAGVAGGDAAAKLAQELRTALQQPFTIDTMKVEIDASIGVACYPRDGRDSHEMLRSADVAMYEAKHKGIGVTEYNRSADQHTPARLELMSQLGNAIRSGQLCLHYQPKLDLATRRIAGVEALVRWNHPERGLLYPEHFLPLAEMGESIHLLTSEVIQQALQQQQKWRQHGLDISVSINLSARNLLDDRCVKHFRALLQLTGVPPERVEVEITETALMIDPVASARHLNQLSDMGIRIVIDDYGTGYSSLGYLQRLSPDVLKIDRQFVRTMLGEPHNAIIVRSTIAMAHSLGLKVVAEGVEDGDTEAVLAHMHCDQIQGYYLAVPMPAEKVASWIFDWANRQADLINGHLA